MPIHIKCECGAFSDFPDSDAGKTATCPRCGALLRVENQDVMATPSSSGELRQESSWAAGGSSFLTIDQLRDPDEKSALMIMAIASAPIWLILLIWIIATFGVGLVIIGFIWLSRRMGELFAAAYIKTNAVQVSPTQLPELHQVVQQCAQRLRMEPPAVYVLQQNVFNAFAAKLGGGRIVVLLSGAVDSILLKGDTHQIAFLVGHEFGHHLAGHLDTRHRLAHLGAWLIWVYLWYSRRREITCDRVGLYCCGSLKAALAAMANMTVGAQLASHVNIDEAVRQWQYHRGEFYVKYRTVYSTYPHHLWRMEELQKAASELGVAA